jgi:polysaccharide deacetylase family protein (PEP-CTERM system associated)
MNGTCLTSVILSVAKNLFPMAQRPFALLRVAQFAWLCTIPDGDVMRAGMMNVLSIDVENWHDVCGAEESLRGYAERSDGVSAVVGTRRILELLRNSGARATFFVVGKIADSHPGLVKEIAHAGHEVAVHGYSHRRIGELGPEGFEADARRGRKTVGDALGETPSGFRAPGWSMGDGTVWALGALARIGFEYDSSVVPSWMFRAAGFPVGPSCIETTAGRIWEFPATTHPYFFGRVPFCSGLSLRVAPVSYLRRRLAGLNSRGVPAMVMVHSWEMDGGHPFVNIPQPGMFAHYHKLASAEPKLRGMLKDFRFGSIRDVHLSRNGRRGSLR